MQGQIPLVVKKRELHSIYLILTFIRRTFGTKDAMKLAKHVSENK